MTIQELYDLAKSKDEQDSTLKIAYYKGSKLKRQEVSEDDINFYGDDTIIFMD